MNQCKKCRSKEFLINENYVWEGKLEKGILYIKHETSEFKDVICIKCKTKYETDEFKSIETV